MLAAPDALEDHPPIAPRGQGMPTNLINDVLVARDGAVYVATTTGLVASRDRGRTWHFLRGADWEAKARGLYEPPPEALLQSAVALAAGQTLLLEDYVTCLAEDDLGDLWVGHREKGCELFDPKSGARLKQGPVRPPGQDRHFDYATRLLLQDDGLAAATYGMGLAHVSGPPPAFGGRVASSAARTHQKTLASSAHGDQPHPPLPAPAKPPTIEQLQTMAIAAGRAGKGGTGPQFLGEDWTTLGDWVGRYGRQYAMLCAMDSPDNHEIDYGASPWRARGGIGPHHTDGDTIRNWIHWVKTDNLNSLYDPVEAIRRQAEWDDHSEAYPRTYEGPDIWITVNVPEEVHRVSLYFFNKDGQEGNNRFRDYVAEVFPVGKGAGPGRPAARTRIRDFHGGVYKQFVVAGPGQFRIKIARNGSFCTLCSAVMIDRLTGPPLPYWRTVMLWGGGLTYVPPPPEPEHDAEPSAPALAARTITARELWSAAEAAWKRHGGAIAQRENRLAAYRAAAADPASGALLANWRWAVPLWTQAERAEFRDVMALAWHKAQVFSPALRTKEFRQYSPNICDTPEEWATKYLTADEREELSQDGLAGR